MVSRVSQNKFELNWSNQPVKWVQEACLRYSPGLSGGQIMLLKLSQSQGIPRFWKSVVETKIFHLDPQRMGMSKAQFFWDTLDTVKDEPESFRTALHSRQIRGIKGIMLFFSFYLLFLITNSLVYLLLLKKLVNISLPDSRRHPNRINLLLILLD